MSRMCEMSCSMMNFSVDTSSCSTIGTASGAVKSSIAIKFRGSSTASTFVSPCAECIAMAFL